jgi:hypothetical protein
MEVAVTGTRNGMTKMQKDSFVNVMKRLENVTAFHHGDCVGVDDEAANLVHENMPDVEIVCHPPTNNSLRAHNRLQSQTRPAFGYLARNRRMVDETHTLIVVPQQEEWQPIGGTWYTHDYARASNTKQVFIIWPDGQTSSYPPTEAYSYSL